MKYKLIAKSNIKEFNQEVTEYLEKGWILYGDPFANSGVYCQAVIDVSDELTTLSTFIPNPDRLGVVNPKDIN